MIKAGGTKRKHQAATSTSNKWKRREPKWVLPSQEELEAIQYKDDDSIDNRPLLTNSCTWSYYSTLDEKFLSFENGHVYVEEYPTYTPHAAAAGSIVTQVLAQAANALRYMVDATYHIPGVGARQPDACFVGRHVPRPGVGGVGAANPQGAPWPAVLLEICYLRSLATGTRKAVQWLGANTGVQVVIIIKIYPIDVNGGIGMVALRFERGIVGPAYAISFGTRALAPGPVAAINALGGAQLVGVGVAGAAACNAHGIAIYMLQIPSALAVIGIPAAHMPAGLPANWNIDLFEVQQDVLEA